MKIKKILAMLLTFTMVLAMCVSVSSVTTMAAVDYTGGTLIGDYTLNEAFSKTELGKKVIKELNADNTDYEVTYSDAGVTVTQAADGIADGAETPELAINLLSLVENDNYNTETYQQGFVGTYAFEITFNVNVVKESTITGNKYWKLYLCDQPNETELSGSSHKTIMSFWNNSRHRLNNNSVNFGNYTANADRTIRLTVDTNTNTVYCYVIEDGSYSEKGSVTTYNLDALTSLTLSPNTQVAKGSQITFKNIKIYEIAPDEETATTLSTFLPEKIVDDANNVTGSFTMPAELAAEGITVTSSDEAVVATNGTVGEVTEPTEVSITVDANPVLGIYLTKVYNLLVKPSTLPAGYLDLTYDSATNKAVAQFKLDSTYEGKNVCLILAVYDSNKLVEKLYTCSTGEVLSCETDALQSGDLVKAFLFDSITSGIPYVNLQALTIN